MDKLNLEQQYQFYLTLSKLEESKMHPIQKKQLRETFMAACGIMLVILKEEIADLEEDKAVEALDRLDEQVNNFFIKATLEQN